MRRLFVLAAILLIAGCGGGGAPPPPVEKPHVLTWDAPRTWTDNSALLPEWDIQRYDVYAADNAAFTDNDVVASVSGSDNGAVVDWFDLALLYDHGITGERMLTVRAVSWDNVASPCADPVWWE